MRWHVCQRCPPVPQCKSKLGHFQSALTEKLCRSGTLNARALNVLMLLTAYQAKLFEDYTQAHNLAILDEVPVITDLCLHIHCCMVQASTRYCRSAHDGLTSLNSLIERKMWFWICRLFPKGSTAGRSMRQRCKGEE